MIRKIFSFLTWGFFALCLISSAYAADQKIAIVKSTGASLYSKPDKSATVTDALKKEDKVMIFDQDGDWYMIRLADKRVGWVHKEVFGETSGGKKTESPKPAAKKSDEKPSASGKKIPPIADSEPPLEDKLDDKLDDDVKPEDAAAAPIKGASDESEKMATLKVITGRVRVEPSQDAKIQFELKKGDTVSIIESKDGWYHLKTQDGRIGWAHQSLFSMDSSAKGVSFKEVKEIRVDKTPEGEEKITFVLSGFYPPKTFVSEEDSPKIVCDFPEARASEHIKQTIPVNGTYLKKIRVGIHEGPPSKLRVVLDMVPNKNYSVKQTFFKKENLYTLTLKAGN